MKNKNPFDKNDVLNDLNSPAIEPIEASPLSISEERASNTDKIKENTLLAGLQCQTDFSGGNQIENCTPPPPPPRR